MPQYKPIQFYPRYWNDIKELAELLTQQGQISTGDETYNISLQEAAHTAVVEKLQRMKLAEARK